MIISTVMVLGLALIGAVTVCTQLLNLGDKLAERTKKKMRVKPSFLYSWITSVPELLTLKLKESAASAEAS